MIQHLHDREKALESFGWKGREAEWIALVCLHSGVFTRAQFRYFFESGDNRKRAERFVRDLFEARAGSGVPLAPRLAEQARRRKGLPNFQQRDLPGAWD